MERVGVFSGTFDPVHAGHMAFAKDAIRICKLDKVFFLVEPRPRRKQGVKAFEHRNAMVEIVTKKEAKLGNIVLEQSRFTVSETLPILQSRFKGAQLYFLMGEDFLDHLGGWPNVVDLIPNVHFVIGLRKQLSETAEEKLKILSQTKGVQFHYTIIKSKFSDITASRIRSYIKADKTPTGLHPSVERYIAKNRLYSSSFRA